MNSSDSSDNADNAADWIPVAAAVRLVPSPRPGKRTCLSTIYRWIAAGRLDCRERPQGDRAGRRRWLFVRRSQVLRLLWAGPEPKPQPTPPDLPSAQELAERDRWTEQTLRRLGLTPTGERIAKT